MTTPSSTLAEGVWGGEQVTLTVGPDRAVLRLGCAQGELSAPIRLRAEGKFSLEGNFQADSGGPTHTSARPGKARYEGTATDGTLKLTVTHPGGADTYQLRHGLQSKVIRCL